MENLLNIIFPPKCLFCNTVGSAFCTSCLQGCPLLEMHKYALTSKGLPRHLSVISCFDYDGAVRQCIKRSKYGGNEFASLNILTRFGIEYLYKLGYAQTTGLVVPIPCSSKKLKERGFNQAELIANIFAQKFKLHMQKSILIRQKTTESQFKFGRQSRFENMKDAFACLPEKVKGKCIVLVDDICTSGATLIEAAKCLYKNGAEYVEAFTLSRSTSP